MEITKENPNNTPEKDINPNMDEVVSLDDTHKETRNNYGPRIPKNHLISNVIGHVNELVVARWQSRLNEMGLVCYTS